MNQINSIWQTDFVIAHTQMLAGSFRKWTGRDLLPGVFNPAGLSRHVFEAPFVVVSHGTESDPVLDYGNQSALALWEMSWEEFTRTPSRLTAEAPNRDERARLLKIVRNTVSLMIIPVCAFPKPDGALRFQTR